MKVPFSFGLYLVVTNPVVSYQKCCEAAVEAGLKFVQLRMKGGLGRPLEMDGAELRRKRLETARDFASIVKGSGTWFIMDDDPVIAEESGADGVHLGQDDISIEQARANHPSLKIFGLSTHNPAQLDAAVSSNPDYCGVGPVFATPTKAIPDPVLGVELAGRMVQSSKIPTVAIGGINSSNARDVIRAGAVNIAVVRDVCRSDKPLDAIRRLQDICFG